MSKTQDAEAPKLSEVKVQVLSILGTGEASTVMLILDKRPGGRRYALRKLKREDEADDLPIERARAETEASAKLGNPAILKVHDFRLVKSFFKVTGAEQLMEYVDGKTLDELIGTIEIKPALVVFQKVASALAHMHRRQVLHGDLQPSSVVLGKTGVVKVRGYGRSEIDEKFKEKIQFNQNYAAPEQVKSKLVTPQSEVYTLGATMYHVLTGQPPIADLRGRTEGQKLAMPTALNVKIPTNVNNLIVTCLQTNPNKRPAEPYNVLQELDKIVKEMDLDDSLLAGIAAPEE